MNNMQFDEATQTYHGTVELYRWSGEGEGQIFTGVNKPLQVTPDWAAQSYKDVFANYWQNQQRNEGGWDSFAARPWHFMRQHQNPLAQPTDSALGQLIQAMAGFSPTLSEGRENSTVGWHSYAQVFGTDAGC